MKRFFVGLMILGMVILFGTAGASDIGSIGIEQACVQGIASVGFLFAGILGLKVRHMRRMQKTYQCLTEKGTYVLSGRQEIKKTA